MNLRTALSALAAVSALGLPALSQQHQNAYLYTHFDLPVSDAYNVDQDLTVGESAGASFWALVWKWSGENFGGYIGLQPTGNGPNGQQLGRMAIFSLWNANAVEAHGAALGGTFGGEGTGYTLRLHYPFEPRHTYRLRMWREEITPEGVWWGAWILDRQTGIETYLGRIRSDSAHETLNGQSVENFSEYYGPQMPTCDDVPRTRVYWSLPQVRGLGSADPVRGTYTNYFRGPCTNGEARLIRRRSAASSPSMGATWSQDAFEHLPRAWNVQVVMGGQ